MSVTGNLYNPMALACALPESKPVVFVIGAMAAGHITVTQHPYVRTLADPYGRECRGLVLLGDSVSSVLTNLSYCTQNTHRSRR